MKSLLSYGSLVALVALVLFVESATCALATTYTWVGAGTGGNTTTDPSDPSTLWGTASNWSPSGVPGSNDTAWLVLTNAGYVNAQNASLNTLYVDGTAATGALSIGPTATFSPFIMYLGYNAIGNAVQRDGTLSSSTMCLGYNSGSSGYYSLSGGQLTAENQEEIGYSGLGTFTQTGGIHTIYYYLYLGYNAGSAGSYTLSGGQLNEAAATPSGEGGGRIGYSGSGTFTQTGGTHTDINLLYLGYNAGSSGIYNLSNGSLAGSAEYIGYGGTGIFNQTGGMHSVYNLSVGGIGSGSSGSYTLSSGLLLTQNSESVADSGTGTFNQSGGSNTAGSLSIGMSGSYTLTGGTLTVTGQIAGSGPLIIDGGCWSCQSISAPLILASNPTVNLVYALSNSSALSSGANYVGQSGTVSLVQSGGTQSAGSLYLGYNAGASGNYSLSAGSLNSTLNEYLGYIGTGTFNQAGGTHTVGDYSNLYLGYNSGSGGSYNLSNGQLTAQGSEYVGSSGTGSFAETGGTHSANYLYLGNNSGSGGSYSLSNGELIVQGYEYVGYSGTGTFTQTGGTHSVGYNSLSLGYNSGSSGTYSLSSGQLTVQGSENIGYNGAGTFNQTGGTHSVNDLYLGTNSGSSGSYTLSNGQLMVQGYENIGSSNASYGPSTGTGVFIQTGGTNSVGVSLWLGVWRTSGGTYTLSNGFLTGQEEEVGRSSIGVFNQTGGTNIISSDLSVGWDFDSTGTYSLSNGQLTVFGSEYVGARYLTNAGSTIGVGGISTFVQTGGTHVVTGSLSIASSGAFLLDAGSLSVTTLSNTGSFALQGGTLAVTNSLTIWGQFTLNGTIQSLLANGVVTSAGTLQLGSGSFALNSLQVQGPLVMAGGTVEAGTVSVLGVAGGKIQGTGVIAGSITADEFSQIVASGGNLTLGDSTNYLGFRTAGLLNVGASVMTLNSLGFATLGGLTTLSGGTLVATNGITVGLGGALSGAGVVNAKIAAGLGSTIAATGNLTLGTATSPVGFTSAGELYTNANTVTINDSNQAVLGSLTQLGAAGSSGTLNAANGLVVDTGNNLVGQGTVISTNSSSTATIINGSVQGTGSGLTFTGYVTGSGTFSGPVTFAGTYTPGPSTASVQMQNMTLVPTSTLLMEIGGQSPGSQFDVVNLSGQVALGGTLEVALVNGFRPADNEQFTIITAGTLNGSFATQSGLNLGARLQLVPSYTSNGVVLTAVQGGSGSWQVDSNGAASVSTNWSGGLPNGAGDTATFGAVITQARTVTIDEPTVLGEIVFDSPQSYTLSGTGTNTLTLDNSGSGATIAVTEGSEAIAAPLVLADKLTVIGSGTLAFGKSSSITGGYTLTMSGVGGTLILSGTDTYTGGTVVTSGTLILTSNTAIASGTSLTVGAQQQRSSRCRRLSPPR